MKFWSGLVLGVAMVAGLPAQTGNRKATDNKLSPSAETSITLNGHKITIEYNAPSARGRKIEGGLIPYDRIYRLGADSATTLTTDSDITIGTLKVPKGVHTLYLAAKSDNDWSLVVNNQVGQWGTQYDQTKDLGRVPMKVSKQASPVETFKITLDSGGKNEGTLTVEWGNSKATVPVKAS
jgi:hypothetical protein